MQECDVEAFRTMAGSLVDEHNAFLFGIFELGRQVFHGKGHVLDALAFLLDEFADRAVRSGGFQQFDLGLTYLEESGADFLFGYFSPRASS